MLERRSARSTSPEEALSFFLEAARKKLGVTTLTVTSEDGELVAGAGDAPDIVAGLGMKIDAGIAASAALATWRMSIGMRNYVIASLGGKLNIDVGEGVRRILVEQRARRAH
jgi:hypothetical protein